MMGKDTIKTKKTFSPIAIIGISTFFANSNNPKEFWENILNKNDLITEVPPSHWLIEDYFDPEGGMDKTYCKRGSFLNYQDFDPLEHGIPPTVVPATDPAQLLSLIAAKKVLHEATKGQYASMDLSRVSVILGSSPLQALQNSIGRLQHPVWAKALREYGLPEEEVKSICDNMSSHYIPWQENTFPGLLSNVIAGRIANRFNLGGTNCITDAACAGSLAAMSMAISELQIGTSDLVITGGVDSLNDIFMFMCFSKTQALSFSGDCRPFSEKADGTVLGEGIGMFALKRLEDAEAQGDKIYAVIRGVGTSSDGRSKSIYAPVAEGQSKALLRAFETAGYAPETVELIEAHGTGTKAGDAAEFNGLKIAFKNAGLQNCALGSIKSQIGHTKSAAGAAGIFKAAMALHHKILPPTIKIDKPNPAFDIDNSPFYFNTDTRPWIKSKHPRRAGVSSFGFGGSNFHITLEEYTGKNKPARLRLLPAELIVITDNDSVSLLKQCEKRMTQEMSLAGLAYQTQHQFNKEHSVRLAIVADNLESFKKKLQQAISFIKESPQQAFMLEQGIYYGNRQSTQNKLAILFPPIGSEYVGMGSDVMMSFEKCMSSWDQSDLRDIVFPKPSFDDKKRKAEEQKLHSEQYASRALNQTSLMYLELLTGLTIQADVKLGQKKLLTKLEYETEIQKCYQKGIKTFIELGPNNHLTKWIQAAFPTNEVNAISLDRRGEQGVTFLWKALAKLVTLGFNPLFTSLWEGYAIPIEEINAVSNHAIKINGAHYGKPYPSLQLKEQSMPSNNNPISNQLQELQKQLIESHNHFQKVMAETHAAFLHVVNNLMNPGQMQLAAAAPAFSMPVQQPIAAPAFAAPTPSFQPVAQSVATPAPSSIQDFGISYVDPKQTSNGMLHSVQSAQPVVVPMPAVETKSAPAAQHSDLESLLLDIVVEKTGYPKEMLTMDMAIEGDLGIDSIKRVEILSSLTERVPHLPEVNANELAQLQTLGDIVGYMRSKAN